MKNHFVILIVFICFSCKKDKINTCQKIGKIPCEIYYCISDEQFSNTPYIYDVSLSRSQIQQNDSIKIKFSFKDGTGNFDWVKWWDCLDYCAQICFDTTFLPVIWITDTRVDCFQLFIFPIYESLNASISGEIEVTLSGICCYKGGSACIPSTQYPNDTVIYKIKIKNKAGFVSNEIETPPLFLLCN